MKRLCYFLLIFSLLSGSGTWIFYNKYKHATRKVQKIPIDPVCFRKKLLKAPPEWMEKQIEKDLAPYRKGITKKMLDEAFRGEKVERFNLIRFFIEKKHISVCHDEKTQEKRHFRELFGCIKTLVEHVDLPEVDFIVSLEDGFDDNPGLGPSFVFAKKLDVEDLILIPDIKALAGYGRLRKEIPLASQKNPWKDKIKKAFWRGSTTGGYLSLRSWENLARVRLVLLSLEYGKKLDAKFHHIVQNDPEIEPLFKAKGMTSKSVSRAKHLQYKYLVDVDGNSCSYERLFWALLSNSLVVKQITDNVQWYYGGLQPYVHYLPVKEDLSDLIEKLNWAEAHDAQCEKMAEEATRFVEENISPEDTLLYLYHLLLRYAALLKSS